jgi:hypothetical protein
MPVSCVPAAVVVPQERRPVEGIRITPPAWKSSLITPDIESAGEPVDTSKNPVVKSPANANDGVATAPTGSTITLLKVRGLVLVPATAGGVIVAMPEVEPDNPNSVAIASPVDINPGIDTESNPANPV